MTEAPAYTAMVTPNAPARKVHLMQLAYYAILIGLLLSAVFTCLGVL